MDIVRKLLGEYQQTLKIDLCFQGFAEELNSLPGRYAPPGGAILLAEGDGGDIAGLVAMRPIDPFAAEMKRLYVRSDRQGDGLGRALAEALIASARERGYSRLRLDTLPSMERAAALYRKLGFVEIGPYVPNPVEGALFFELTL